MVWLLRLYQHQGSADNSRVSDFISVSLLQKLSLSDEEAQVLQWNWILFASFVDKWR